MDDKPKHRPSRRAEEKALEAVDTSSTKKRSTSTHGHAGRPQKAHKRTPSARVDKGAEDVSTQLHMASHNNLIEQETIIYASDMENQIAAEAREVTRKNIPWDKFCSTYLCDFSVKAQPKLAVESVKKIGKGNWEEKLFWNRLRKVLSHEVRCSRCTFICLSVLC
jgi:hypothetical protein